MSQGIDTPGVEELPQGDEILGVTPKGDGVQGEDRRGQGGYGTPPPPKKLRHTETAAEMRR